MLNKKYALNIEQRLTTTVVSNNHRGQCYDGASNMTGSMHGVATQLLAEEPRAIPTHCYGHALNLAVADAMKQSKVCRDALDTAYEVSKLIRFQLRGMLSLTASRWRIQLMKNLAQAMASVPFVQ